MTAKPKRDVRLPKASLLERLDKPTGPDLRPELDGYVSRLKIVEALQDKHEKDLAWLKTGLESQASELKDFADQLDRFAKPSLWPLWTMLLVELAGLAYLALKIHGVDIP